MEQRSNPFSAVLNNFKLDINGSVGTLITFFDNWLGLYPHMRQPTGEELGVVIDLLADLRDYYQSRRLNDFHNWPQHRTTEFINHVFEQYTDIVCNTWELGDTSEQVSKTLTSGLLEYFYNPGKMLTGEIPLSKAIGYKSAVKLFAAGPAASEYVALVDLLERSCSPDRKGWNDHFVFSDPQVSYIQSDSGKWVTAGEPVSIEEKEESTSECPEKAQPTVRNVCREKRPGCQYSNRLQDLALAALLVRDPRSGVRVFTVTIDVGSTPQRPCLLNFVVTKETVTISASRTNELDASRPKEQYVARPLDWVRIFLETMPEVPAGLLRERLDAAVDVASRQPVDRLVLPTSWFCTQYPGLLVGAPVETCL